MKRTCILTILYILVAVGAAQAATPATATNLSSPNAQAAVMTHPPSVSTTQPVLLKATTHPMNYYLSLPVGWTTARKWPILIIVEAHPPFNQNIAKFIEARGNLPFIIVVPVNLNNASTPPVVAQYSREVHELATRVGGPKFDEEGLLAVIKDVQNQCNGAEKSYITGFSAGGNTTWIMTLYHPDFFAGVAFSSGSYSGRGIFSELVSQAPERETLPIMFFEGALYASIKENYARFQTVKSIAENGGFHNITYQVTPGVGHAWQLEKTFKYFADLYFKGQGE